MDEQPVAALRAFVEEMIPSDDLPGAREAGTADEVLKALAMDSPIWDGLRALDVSSRSLFRMSFAEATSEQRQELMGQLSRGEQPAGWDGPNVPGFWMGLRNLSLSLFYGSEISRQVTGFPGPSVDKGGYRHTIVEPEPKPSP